MATHPYFSLATARQFQNFFESTGCSINTDCGRDGPCQLFAMLLNVTTDLHSLEYVASFATVSDALWYAEKNALRHFHVTADIDGE